MIQDQWRLCQSNQERYEKAKNLLDDYNDFGDYLKPIVLDLLLDDEIVIEKMISYFDKLISHELAFKRFLEGSQCKKFLELNKKNDRFQIKISEAKRMEWMDWFSQHFALFQGVDISAINKLFQVKTAKGVIPLAPFVGENS